MEECILISSLKHPMRNLKKLLDEGLIQIEPLLEQKRKDMEISKNKNSKK